MHRAILLLSIASVLSPSSAASAQGFGKSPDALNQRLSKIEQKLEQLVEELRELTKARRGPRAEAEPGAEGPAAQVHIYALKHANAQDLAAVLRELFRDRRLSLSVDPRTNSLLVVSDMNATIETILSRLDVPTQPKTDEKKESPEPKKTPVPPGEKKPRLERLRNEVEATRADVEMRRERLAWAERMVEKGYLARSQATADGARLRAAQAALERAQAELRTVLQEQPMRK